MEKKVAIICSILFASSVNVKAFNTIRVQMPVELAIDIQDPNNPRAEFLNVKSDLTPGSKWVMLPQVAAMFDPNNSGAPVVLLDVKKTILKLIVQHPEIIERAGIRPEDFVNAGISPSELQILRREAFRPEEISFLAQLSVDFFDGGVSDGLKYMQEGGIELIKGSANFGFGTAILLKKAAVATVKFLKSWFDDVTESEKEAR